MPGLSTTRSGKTAKLAKLSGLASSTFIPSAVKQLARFCKSALLPLSSKQTSAPWAFSKRAAPVPERPKPTTTTRSCIDLKIEWAILESNQ